MKQKIVFSTNFKRNYVACFAIFLFLLIVLGEIVLAVSIPAYMNRENAMALQVNKLRFLEHFDLARSVCNYVKGKDETLLLEKKLLSSALDEMAIALRKGSDDLTMEEINHLDRVVAEAIKIARKLQQGQTFSQTNQVNTKDYIHLVLKQNQQEISHGQK